MKVLFVTTHPPFPPVDGVRIPEANHLLGLKIKHSVDCLILSCPAFPYTNSDIIATGEKCDTLYEIGVREPSKFLAILNELVFGFPYYGRWQLNPNLPSELINKKYDVIWAATAPSAGILAKPKVRAQLPKARYYIAGLSDVHSLVLHLLNPSYFNKGLLLRTIEAVAKSTRVKVLSRAEVSMLDSYDLCTMQTHKEFDWVVTLRDSLREKCLVLPNGVENSLFEIPIARTNKNLLFIGLLSGIYDDRCWWFFEKVWPHVLKKHPDATALVVGKGANAKLREYLSEVKVNYIPYVEVLSDIYKRQAVMVAPVFKGYGIINKVLESMAAGTLAVGDKTAFNGIDGFENNKHGLIANDVEDFILKIDECFNSSDFLGKVRAQGRVLAKKNFSWESRYNLLLKKIRKFE